MVARAGSRDRSDGRCTSASVPAVVLRRAKGVTVAAVAITVLAASAPGAGPALPFAAPSTAAAQSRPGAIDRAVQRLQIAQRSDGGFAVEPASPSSDPSTSVWAALALGAVGVHPGAQPAKGTTLLSYLERRAGTLQDTGDLARLLLVLRAAGQGQDDAAQTATRRLRARQQGGAFPDAATGSPRVEATAFAALALAIGDDADEAAAKQAAEWLVRARGAAGWGATPRAAARTRPTAIALQALDAAGVAAPDSAATSFLEGLRSASADGGIAERAGARSDTVSTAWGIQGLTAVGLRPLASGTAGVTGDDGVERTVKTYLRERQRSDGGFGSTLRTAQVLPGLNGTTLPFAAVSRATSDRASDRAPGTPNAASTGGSGGSDGLDGASAQNGGSGGGSSTPAPSTNGGTGGGGTGGGSSESLPPAGGSVSGAGDLPPATTSSAPPPTTTQAAPPATTAAAPPTTTTDGQQVSGAVVGASGAPEAPGVASGGGSAGDDEDRAAIVLALAILAAVVLGAGLERRAPRRTA